MSQRMFRFVHACDLQLEQAPRGLAEVPDHLRELLLESPYWAAERVFEAALAEQVDFVVLAGGVTNYALAGPRGAQFLLDQFQRLSERNIRVYWAGGPDDLPDSWPSAFPLPDNVHFFSAARFEEVVHLRGDEPLARLVGQSRRQAGPIRAGDLHSVEDNGAFRLAVVPAMLEPGNFAQRGIAYWALGGLPNRESWSGPGYMAHCPGSTQGRDPTSDGAHGCSVVHVDLDGRVRINLVATEAVRYCHERLTVDGGTTRQGLERMLAARVEELGVLAHGADLLIQWTVGGTGRLLAELRKEEVSTEVLHAMRNRFGKQSPSAWSVSLQAEPDAALAARAIEQDSILGDALRHVHELLSRDEMGHEDLDLDLGTSIDAAWAGNQVAAAVRITEGQNRHRVLRKAAAMCLDYLSVEGHGP